MILQAGLENSIDILRTLGFHLFLDVIDTVNKTHIFRFLRRDPVILSVEVSILDLFTCPAQTGGIHVGKRILQGLQLVTYVPELLLVSVASAIGSVQHQTGILAHIDRLPAQGDDAGHAGGNSVDIDGNVSLTAAKGVENGHTGIYAASGRVDTYVYVLVHRSVFIQLRNDVLVADPIKTAYLPVEENAGGIRGRYHVEVSLFHAVVFKIMTQI